uniref:Cobalt-precorrin 5A hydrolase n=1 Tax=Candidatus Kentrum sp. MB TaxID=2138164 RepID=A0A450XE99_9GAMM|nr:MAG: cobalt-precorrin 5A hydrolase [Candidatus Kentron sp. MB]VFK74356.1 MAG: cobalt-precorrin 5A hydrolase [Candidatus Kentron sp. MB]
MLITTGFASPRLRVSAVSIRRKVNRRGAEAQRRKIGNTFQSFPNAPLNNLDPPTILVAVTRGGTRLARRLALCMPDAHMLVAEKFSITAGLANQVISYDGPLSARIGQLFSRYNRIVFFLSLGAVVRLIAPHLKSKYLDPAIVVVDDTGRFVIPVLSGHVGGANALARELAGLLDATPVITTVSDVNNTLSVDILGRELGWRVEASKTTLTRVSAHVVNREPIAFVQETGSDAWWPHQTPLPSNIHRFHRIEDVELDRFQAVLWVTDREADASLLRQLSQRLVIYRPSDETEPTGKHRNPS